MIESRLLGRFGSNGLAQSAWAIGLTVAFFIALAVAACSSPAESEHAGHGTAVEIDHKARTVTLDHEDIPGLMMGMTMTFAVAPEVDLEAVEKGAVVDFRVKSVGSEVTVTEIRPAAP